MLLGCGRRFRATANLGQPRSQIARAKLELPGQPRQQLLDFEALGSGRRRIARTGDQSAGQRRQNLLERLIRAMRLPREIDPADRRGNLVLESIDRRAEQFAEGVAPPLQDELRGIKLLGERKNSQVDVGRDKQFQDFVRPPLAGCIAIEDEKNRVGKAAERADMLLRQGRAAASHDVVDPFLMAQDHIGVPFDDGQLPRAGDMCLRQIERIERVALRVESRFPRVDILARSLGGKFRQDSPAKSHGPGLRVADREHDPSAEKVAVLAAILVPRRQPGCLQDGRRKGCLPRPVDEPGVVLRREADRELVDAGGRDRSFGEVASSRLGSFRLQQVIVKLPRGPLAAAVERRLIVGAAGLGLRLPLRRQRDPGPLGQQCECFAKVASLLLHDKAEGIAADVAYPAFPGLPIRVYLQAGRSVFVPGAEPLEEPTARRSAIDRPTSSTMSVAWRTCSLASAFCTADSCIGSGPREGAANCRSITRQVGQVREPAASEGPAAADDCPEHNCTERKLPHLASLPSTGSVDSVPSLARAESYAELARLRSSSTLGVLVCESLSHRFWDRRERGGAMARSASGGRTLLGSCCQIAAVRPHVGDSAPGSHSLTISDWGNTPY